MQRIVPVRRADLGKISLYRSGEVRFGEKMITLPKDEDFVAFMRECPARFVLLGLPEDIGIRANSGKAGSGSVWEAALTEIANIQHNKFCKGDDILILGPMDFSGEMAQAAALDFMDTRQRLELSALVQRIDKEVAHVIFTIASCGKIPIIIGGGQNNAYGNIKGMALALEKPVNAVNFDAKSDFRILEGRHNGNAFHYAYQDGFLKNYFIFGMHENQVSKDVLKRIKKLNSRVKYATYDAMAVYRETDFEKQLDRCLNFVNTDAYGIEVDLNAVSYSTGNAVGAFDAARLRQFVSFMADNPNAAYLHLCEGVASEDNSEHNRLLGGLIAYLLTDFMKALQKHLPSPGQQP